MVVSNGAPTVAEPYLVSESVNFRVKLLRNLARQDAIGRYGAGAYAIAWQAGPNVTTPSFNLTAPGGLNLGIGAGAAMIDGAVELAATTLALTDNIARVYIWLGRSGVLYQVNNSTAAPSAEPVVFLGSCVTSAGAISGIDTSGVLYYRSASLMRETADSATPTDTPPAGISFLNLGPTNAWWWTGSRYLSFAEQAAFADTVVAAGTTLTIPAGKQLVVAELDVQGTLAVNGTLRIVGV
jgi:hypothetical protein